jgi:hypothetical protein
MNRVYDPAAMKHSDEIWRAASFLLERYGQDAQTAAMQHSQWLLQSGDVSGHMLWSRVIRAIQELGRAGMKESERPN